MNVSFFKNQFRKLKKECNFFDIEISMKITLSIWMFYKKLVIPTLAMSALIVFLTFLYSDLLSFSLTFRILGVSYIIFTPMFHYFIYEVRNPNEYYFYYNMGISKLVLWFSTLILSALIGLIMIMIML